MANYADYTYNAKNPLRRFSHRTRFNNAVASIPTNSPLRLLDFGCGDGLFINQLRNKTGSTSLLMGYEPFLDPYAENAENIVQNWSEVESVVGLNGFFDVVTCFEVLEHLPSQLLIETLERIYQVLSPDGLVVISVPIEKGLPALLKGFLRRREGENYQRIWSIRNIWRSFCQKPVDRYLADEGYLHHMGFYFNDLEREFEQFFTIENRSFSPLKGFGSHFNSQVFYRLRKK